MRFSGKPPRRFLVLALLALLGACSSVPLRTMWKLHSFGAGDFATLDPAALRVAVGLEKGHSAGGVILAMDIRPAQESPARARHFRFDLVPAAADGPVETPGGQPNFWRLAPADVPHFQRLQHLIAVAHEQHRKTAMKLSARATHIFAAGEQPRAIHISVYLRLAPDQPYLALLRDAVIPIPDRPADDRG